MSAGVVRDPPQDEAHAPPTRAFEQAAAGESPRVARGRNLGCGPDWWRREVIHRRLSYLSTVMCFDFESRKRVDRSEPWVRRNF